MEFRLVLFLGFWAAVADAHLEDLRLEDDQPSQKVAISQEATVRCCYRWKKIPTFSWIMHINTNNGTTLSSKVKMSEVVMSKPYHEKDGVKCHLLYFSSVRLNDTGLYQCLLNYSKIVIFTHGTFLQVYIPFKKSLNLSERVKNSIITAEGVLLLICVLIPGTMLICKSKRLKELEKKKGKEEENIYEGLNLDDCNSAYHQIQRSSQEGPYQDVASRGEDIQLEKP